MNVFKRLAGVFSKNKKHKNEFNTDQPLDEKFNSQNNTFLDPADEWTDFLNENQSDESTGSLTTKNTAGTKNSAFSGANQSSKKKDEAFSTESSYSAQSSTSMQFKPLTLSAQLLDEMNFENANSTAVVSANNAAVASETFFNMGEIDAPLQKHFNAIDKTETSIHTEMHEGPLTSVKQFLSESNAQEQSNSAKSDLAMQQETSTLASQSVNASIQDSSTLPPIMQSENQIEQQNLRQTEQSSEILSIKIIPDETESGISASETTVSTAIAEPEINVPVILQDLQTEKTETSSLSEKKSTAPIISPMVYENYSLGSDVMQKSESEQSAINTENTHSDAFSNFADSKPELQNQNLQAELLVNTNKTLEMASFSAPAPAPENVSKAEISTSEKNQTENGESKIKNPAEENHDAELSKKLSANQEKQSDTIFYEPINTTSDKEISYAKTAEMFLYIRSLAKSLPEFEKINFFTSEQLIHLDYIIETLKSHDGLFKKAVTYYKPAENAEGQIVLPKTIKNTLQYLKYLSHSLGDTDLVHVLDKKVENLLTKI